MPTLQDLWFAFALRIKVVLWRWWLYPQNQGWEKSSELKAHEINKADLKLDATANLNVKKISTNYSLLQSNEPFNFKIWNHCPEWRGFPIVLPVITHMGDGGEGKRVRSWSQAGGCSACAPLGSLSPTTEPPFDFLDVLCGKTWPCPFCGTTNLSPFVLVSSKGNGSRSSLGRVPYSFSWNILHWVL